MSSENTPNRKLDNRRLQMKRTRFALDSQMQCGPDFYRAKITTRIWRRHRIVSHRIASQIYFESNQKSTIKTNIIKQKRKKHTHIKYKFIFFFIVSRFDMNANILCVFSLVLSNSLIFITSALLFFGSSLLSNCRLSVRKMLLGL